jgi:hypothetical protein
MKVGRAATYRLTRQRLKVIVTNACAAVAVRPNGAKFFAPSILADRDGPTTDALLMAKILLALYKLECCIDALTSGKDCMSTSATADPKELTFYTML